MHLTRHRFFIRCARASQHGTNGERGFALIVVLLLLVAMAILGVAGSAGASLQTKMARAERDYQTAFAAAESALSDAEYEIIFGLRVATVGEAVNIYSNKAPGGFSNVAGGCDAGGAFTANTSGLYDMAACANDWWKTMVFTAANSTALGAISGKSIPGKSSSFLYGTQNTPRYTIDRLQDNTPRTSAQGGGYLYRVTAFATGPTADTEVVLQSTVRAPD